MDRKILDRKLGILNLDVLISMAPQTRIWYSDVSTSDGYLFIYKDKADLMVDGRYIEYARNEAQNVNVLLNQGDSLAKYFEGLKDAKRIGVETEYITHAQMEMLKKYLPNALLVPVSAAEVRMVKSDKEIELLQKANDIAMTALERLIPEIKPGVSELELSAKLEYYLRRAGAYKGSFDAIVVSGARGALPHGDPSEKKLAEGELITIDFGALYKGFCSDITRTFQVGKVTDEKLLDIEKVLREAQKRGREAVKPGMTTCQIDKICRDYITEKGYGEYFVHSTGHGLGIDVHEKPNVTANKKFDVTLEPGMVITVEPGIYIEGLGGIRVEDDILVTEDGYKNLSRNIIDN